MASLKLARLLTQFIDQYNFNNPQSSYDFEQNPPKTLGEWLNVISDSAVATNTDLQASLSSGFIGFVTDPMKDALLVLINYLKRREEEPENLGSRFVLFQFNCGFSKSSKCAAALDLLDVLFFGAGENARKLEHHHGALHNGRLGGIFKEMLALEMIQLQTDHIPSIGK